MFVKDVENVVKSRQIGKGLIAVAVIGTATAYLLYNATRYSLVYYYSVDEFAAQANASPDRQTGQIRIAGTVKNEPVLLDAEKRLYKFELAGQKSAIPVQYSGQLPNNFAVNKEVVVEGKTDPQGVFTAKNIITKCESKYKAKNVQK